MVCITQNIEASPFMKPTYFKGKNIKVWLNSDLGPFWVLSEHTPFLGKHWITYYFSHARCGIGSYMFTSRSMAWVKVCLEMVLLSGIPKIDWNWVSSALLFWKLSCKKLWYSYCSKLSKTLWWDQSDQPKCLSFWCYSSFWNFAMVCQNRTPVKCGQSHETCKMYIWICKFCIGFRLNVSPFQVQYLEIEIILLDWQ